MRLSRIDVRRAIAASAQNPKADVPEHQPGADLRDRDAV
jgi:hypothetical protein